MALSVGTKLGPYKILAAIGAGGMGEVYRAHDAKLGRDVALKVLPDVFAHNVERMARFQREAKVLASLDHPNIASIYGLEDSGATHALVMALIEGPTLADRIKLGPIPIEDSLRIAKQICEALEYAHERGIVHRDLKTANVKVTNDDAVKVLDFGLAKAIEGDAASIDIATSPTMSRMATLAGVLLGTAAYMSPEQAKGKPVDRRADIWAFGCVLYEMLTGKITFSGETVTDTLAAVIRAEPDWSELPAAIPMRVRVLLQRCLQKDPKQRLRDIGDARISLEEVLAGAPEGASAVGVSPANAALVRRHALLFSLGALLIGAAIAGLAVWNLKPAPATPRSVTRFTITLPPGQRLSALEQPALAISRDGSQLAYIATTKGDDARQIYVRSMDGVEARPISGTEGATSPFFSPDREWVGFFSYGKLKKIPISGGVAQTLADTTSEPTGGTWGSDHTIAYSPVIVSYILQVSDEGGVSKSLTRLESGETGHVWPEFLPGSKAILFLSILPPRIVVQSIGKGERRNLVQGPTGTMPRYAPSGHLIYAQDGNLMAMPFDWRRLQPVGTAVPVVQGVLQSSDVISPAQFSISDTGSLVYVPGSLTTVQGKLVWVSRSGVEQPLAAPARYYDQPRLSPDGRRVAVDIRENDSSEQVGLYDFARDTLSRFTFEGSFNEYPSWTPDGKRIAFTSNKDGQPSIFWQLADGSGGLERLTSSTTIGVPVSWSPDGQFLAYVEPSGSVSEILMLHVGNSSTNAGQGRQAQRFLQAPSYEDAPQFSPDGHWVAYSSDESGRREIYVRPYPGPGGKWQISTEGGSEPIWNRSGRELFYRVGGKMMAVDINAQPDFTAGKPRQLFEGNYLLNPILNARANYDVSPDGQRFLMVKPVEQGATAPTQINVVLNWTEELKRLVPPGAK